MSARDSLLATLAVLSDCLNDASVVDQAPANASHNARASMLRQGLAVLTFATIETFIRDRTAETLRSFDATKLAFGDLSEKMRQAVTHGAVEGIRFRLKIERPADRVQWLVDHLQPVARVATTINPLSALSFGGVRVESG
jgi:hypothetical protein